MLNYDTLTKARRMILCIRKMVVVYVYIIVVLEAEIFDCGIKTIVFRRLASETSVSFSVVF